MRSPGRGSRSSDREGLKKGPWTPEEDRKLVHYIEKYGQGSWQSLPKRAGLNRCGKSCRLRWTNYLRPDIKRGNFSPDEEQTIIQLHSFLGNKWAMIATHLPGRTDNEIKNFWNTHLRKRLLRSGIDPTTHQPIPILPTSNLNTLITNNFPNLRLLQSLLQVLKCYSLPINGNPLQVSSMATTIVPPLMPISEYQPVFDSFGSMPQLVAAEKAGNNDRSSFIEQFNSTISKNSTDDAENWLLPALGDPTSPELVSSGDVNIYDDDLIGQSHNFGDMWGEAALRDDEGSGSCWKDVLIHESFPL